MRSKVCAINLRRPILSKLIIFNILKRHGRVWWKHHTFFSLFAGTFLELLILYSSRLSELSSGYTKSGRIVTIQKIRKPAGNQK